MDIENKFSGKLRSIRKELGWSQAKLAEKSDLSVEAISNLERGLNNPSFKTIETLSTCLGVSIRDFFEYDDESELRSGLYSALMSTARSLSDIELTRAVKIIQTLRDD